MSVWTGYREPLPLTDVLTGLGQSRPLGQHRLGLRLELGHPLCIGRLQPGVTLNRELEVSGGRRWGGVWPQNCPSHAQRVGDHRHRADGYIGTDPGEAGDIDQRQLPSDYLE